MDSGIDFEIIIFSQGAYFAKDILWPEKRNPAIMIL